MSPNTPESFGQYIKRIRETKGLTLRQLYERSGVSNSYLSQLENAGTSKGGKTISPTLEVIAKIAKGLEVPLGQFLLESGQLSEWDFSGASPETISGITIEFLKSVGINLNREDVDTLQKFTKHLASTKKPTRLSPEELAKREVLIIENGNFRHLEDLLGELHLPGNSFPVTEVVKIPIIGTVKAGEGGVARYDYLGEETVEKKDLNSHRLESYFWLQVKGDSMQPEIYPGDLALVYEQPDIDYSGQLVVVIVNGEEGVIKRVHKSNGNVMLHSVNASYPPRLFTGADLANIRIVGKVIEIKRKFK